MNNADLAVAVAAAHNVTQAQGKEIVSTVVQNIADALVRGDEVSLPGFGKFKVTDKPAGTARNPATGATINVGPSRKAKFTPAKALKDNLKV